MGTRTTEDNLDDLTPRQREVLALIARGRSNPEIATALGVTIDGAKWHVREILSRLGVASREEAASLWRQERRPATRLRGALPALLGSLSVRVALVATAAVVGIGGVAAVVLMLAANGGGSEPAAGDSGPTATGTATASSISPTASPTAPDPDQTPTVRELTSADAAASIPLQVGGLLLSPVGAWRDRILFRAVTPADTGAPTDIEFVAWKPGSDAIELLWSDDFGGSESFIGVDGDWALTLLPAFDAGGIATYRLRNLATGETRDIASAATDDPGVRLHGPALIALGDGFVAYAMATAEGSDVEARLVVYGIAQGTRSVVATWPLNTLEDSPAAYVSASGSRVLAVRLGPGGSLMDIAIRDTQTGATVPFAFADFTSVCELMAEGARAACARRDVANLQVPSGYLLDLIDLGTGATRTMPSINPYVNGWKGYLEYISRADAEPLLVVFDSDRLIEYRALSSPVGELSGAGPFLNGAKLLEGWIAWLEPAYVAGTEDLDPVRSRILFFPLP